MTDLEIMQYKYEQMKKLAREIQGALHHVSNMNFPNRHTGDLELCGEDSCKLFFRAMADIDRLETSIRLADYGTKS